MSNDLQLYEGQQLRVMVEVANSFPRNLNTFVDDVCNEVIKDVEKNRDFALSCIYCVPVGKDENGVQKFVSEPSVRITEVMQKYWKHLRIIVNGEVSNDAITVSGIIVDCQSNNAETLIDRINCKGWSDRRISLKLKAMQSVMKRDLRLSIMGRSYSNELKNRIFSSLFPDISSGWNACIEAFLKYGVTEKRLLQYFKISSTAEITAEILFNALGVYNFMLENGTGVNEIFGAESKKPNITMADIKVLDDKKTVKKPISPKMNGKAPSSQPTSATTPIVAADEFAHMIESMARKTGISVTEGLKCCCGVDDPRDVLPADQSKVMDWFISYGLVYQ